jgi:hypothetical protein
MKNFLTNQKKNEIIGQASSVKLTKTPSEK